MWSSYTHRGVHTVPPEYSSNRWGNVSAKTLYGFTIVLAFESKGCGGTERTQQGEKYREAQGDAPNVPMLLHGGFRSPRGISAVQFSVVVMMWHAWTQVYTSWKCLPNHTTNTLFSTSFSSTTTSPLSSQHNK